MKKILLLLVAILIIGCSKEDDSTIILPDGEKVLVSKIEYYNSGNVLNSTTTFTYNSDGFISKSNGIHVNGFKDENNYIYDNKNIVKIISTDNETNKSSIDEFTYSDNVLVLKTDTDNNEINVIYFEYNSSGYLKTVKYSDETINYTYDLNNNVINNGSATYEYDNKNDYSRFLAPDNFYKIFRKSDHNITKETYPNEVRTYEYIYLSNNYPSQITEKINGEVYQISKIYYK